MCNKRLLPTHTCNRQTPARSSWRVYIPISFHLFTKKPEMFYHHGQKQKKIRSRGPGGRCTSRLVITQPCWLSGGFSFRLARCPGGAPGFTYTTFGNGGVLSAPCRSTAGMQASDLFEIFEDSDTVAPAGGVKTWVDIVFDNLCLHGQVDLRHTTKREGDTSVTVVTQ